jgi:hypothetical protein
VKSRSEHGSKMGDGERWASVDFAVHFFAGNASAIKASPGGTRAAPEVTADYKGAQAAIARLFGSCGDMVCSR